MLLEIARAFKKVKPAPKRSILFLAVTAEEQGLLGSEYYATVPALSARQDARQHQHRRRCNMWGRTKDVTVIGLGASDLDDYARDAAAEQGRALRPDAEPEKGFYYRSDHFNFAKVGVPALDPDAGVEFVGKPAELRQAEARRVHDEGLPPAVRRGEGLVGSVRRGRGRRSCCSRSAIASRRPTSFRSGSRATSSRRRANNRSVRNERAGGRFNGAPGRHRPAVRRKYHDEEWGVPAARRPAPLRDADPRRRAGRLELDHDPPQEARAYRKAFDRLRREEGRALRRARRRARSCRTPASCATG